MDLSSGKLILIGGVLVVAGFVGPLLMVLQLLPSTFWLNFASYAASVAGLVMGLVGAAIYARAYKGNRER